MNILPTNVEFTILPELKDGQTLIIHVDVGNMPAADCVKYIESVKSKFELVNPPAAGVTYFFAPMYGGKKSVDLEITCCQECK